jgi:putative solute:sodium symporter small subunit
MQCRKRAAFQPEDMSMRVTENHKRYWAKNLRITAILLAIWFVVTFVVGFFARDLNFSFFGWPFSYWVGSQGALVVYVLIIGFYARYMNKLDQEHGVAEEE